MRVNRRFLYIGIFLVAIGAVLVVADVGGPDPRSIVDALRLWPLAIVAIGVGLVLRRTRLSLPGGMLAAAVPGLLLGGGLAVASRTASDCGRNGATQTVESRDGVFSHAGRISVTAGCGTLVVGTAPGSGWRFDAGTGSARSATVDASATSLSIESGGGAGWRAGGFGRDDWHVTLPATTIDDLSLVVNAGEGRIALPGTQIGALDVTTNASRADVDLSDASVARVSAEVNAGMLSLRVPASADLAMSLEVNAGALEVCAPTDLGLSVRQTGALSAVSIDGRHLSGAWQSSNYATAIHHADLDIEVNLGNVKIDTIGGCK